jgi:hypothetical protein
MRSTKLSSAVAAAATLLAIAPTAAGATQKLPAPRGHTSLAGCRVSISADPHTVTSGEAVLISGKLFCPPRFSVANQTVLVYEHIAGVPGFKVVGTPTTGADGSYTLTPPVVVTDSTFYSRVEGARSPDRMVKVRPLVTFATSPPLPEGSQLFTGPAHKVTFVGTVNPINAGAEVWLQRESGGSSEEWLTIQTHEFVKADGTFTLVHRFIVPGDANLRAIVRPRGKFGVRGVSNMLSYEISQTQNPDLTLEPKTNPVTVKQPIVLKGTLKAGTIGQKVVLMGRTYNTKFAQVNETTTAAGGSYEFTIPSAVQNTYFRTISGAVKSAVLFEGVKWAVTGTATAGKVTSGSPVTFSGTVAPERAGHTVYLERQTPNSNGFHVVDIGFVTPGATYSITYNVIGSGKQLYRIKVPGDPLNQGASTAPFEMEVAPSLSTTKPPIQPILPR